MKFRYKVFLVAAAIAIASAAGSLNRFGLGATTWQQREALSLFRQINSTFVGFLASERGGCYSQFRTAVDEHTGLWSRHDRSHRQEAAAGR